MLFGRISVLLSGFWVCVYFSLSVGLVWYLVLGWLWVGGCIGDLYLVLFLLSCLLFGGWLLFVLMWFCFVCDLVMV